MPIPETKNIRASIDLGTNSALLLIARVEGKNIETIREELRICRIGEGVDASGILSAKAIQRTIRVLREYKNIAIEYGVSDIIIGATSAVRDGSNSITFINKVKAELELDIEVISGQREAELCFLASSGTIPESCQSALVTDIGGGSTEFISGRRGEIKNLVSCQFGSVRLTEEYIHHNPPKKNEISDMKKHIENELSSMKREKWREECFIGVAGTVTTIAQMIQESPEYRRDEIEGFRISSESLSSLIDRISFVTTQERKKFAGLHPARADVIVSGAVILKEIMDYFGYNETITSTRGLRYGLLMK